MPTAVFVHPHPDDEAIFTGLAMRRAADAGWRVVLAVATGGEEGEMPDWVTVDAADHRRMETAQAAEILGATEVHHLGYRDSGMAGGDPHHTSLARSLDAAADDLADLLRRCGADAVVGQDPNGIYGHPDHVAVHRITARAARVAGVGEVLEATLDRDWLVATRTELIRLGRLDPAVWCAAGVAGLGVARVEDGWAVGPDDEGRPLLRVDSAGEMVAKQAAMAAHASQVPDALDFMGIPPGVFHAVVTHEWFLRRTPAAGSLEAVLAAHEVLPEAP